MTRPSPTVIRRALESRYTIMLEGAPPYHQPVRRGATDDPARVRLIEAILKRLRREEQ